MQTKKDINMNKREILPVVGGGLVVTAGGKKIYFEYEKGKKEVRYIHNSLVLKSR